MTFSEIRFRKTENALESAGFRIGAIMTWEAVVLPIYESCSYHGHYSRQRSEIQPFFVEMDPACAGRRSVV